MMRRPLPTRLAPLALALLLLSSCSGRQLPHPTDAGSAPSRTSSTAPAATAMSTGVAAGAWAAPPQPGGTSESSTTARTFDEKAAARGLAPPIRHCVASRDTGHAAFHGCVDWHSAVHGNYALRVISRLTGDPTDAELAESVANADDLEEELASINSGALDAEIPYGFSWFLILDNEARSPETADPAAAISVRLHRWITGHLESDAVLRPEYHNLSFAVFSLHRWYLGRSADDAGAFRHEVAPSLVAHIGAACSDDRPTDEFFDPCANLLLAVADFDTVDDAIIGDDGLDALVDSVRRRPPLAPDEVATVHSAGLNFSRSWACYVAAPAVNRDELIAIGDDYLQATLNAPHLWSEDYYAYAHWVAQFGVLALDLRSRAGAPLLPGS